MKRREFNRLAVVGSLVGAIPPVSVSAAGKALVAAEMKDWARRHFRGFECSVRPAFSPDFQSIDETGTRHDVRQCIRHGVFSIFCAPSSLSTAERLNFLKLVVKEAAGEVAIGTSAIGDNPAEKVADIKRIEEAGCDHVLVHPPFSYRPETDEELYRYYRSIIDQTRLPVVLWATDGSQFRHLHSSNIPLDVLDRLADLPNVVGLKLMNTLQPAVVFEICERLSRKVMVNCVELGLMPLLVKTYGVQWSGSWTIESLQSVEKPFVVDYLDHLLAGRYEKAMEIFWHIQPAYKNLISIMAPMLPKGVHPAVYLKYFQWCVGGNGGLPRPPEHHGEEEFPLTPEARESIRTAYRAIGITPSENDDTFIVGRANYARGVRPADLPYKPVYVE